ncbi:19573_t:CDS:10, partial [Racocetra persica]
YSLLLAGHEELVAELHEETKTFIPRERVNKDEVSILFDIIRLRDESGGHDEQTAMAELLNCNIVTVSILDNEAGGHYVPLVPNEEELNNSLYLAKLLLKQTIAAAAKQKDIRADKPPLLTDYETGGTADDLELIKKVIRKIKDDNPGDQNKVHGQIEESLQEIIIAGKMTFELTMEGPFTLSFEPYKVAADQIQEAVNLAGEISTKTAANYDDLTDNSPGSIIFKMVRLDDNKLPDEDIEVENWDPSSIGESSENIGKAHYKGGPLNATEIALIKSSTTREKVAENQNKITFRREFRTVGGNAALPDTPENNTLIDNYNKDGITGTQAGNAYNQEEYLEGSTNDNRDLRNRDSVYTRQKKIKVLAYKAAFMQAPPGNNNGRFFGPNGPVIADRSGEIVGWFTTKLTPVDARRAFENAQSWISDTGQITYFLDPVDVVNTAREEALYFLAGKMVPLYQSNGQTTRNFNPLKVKRNQLEEAHQILTAIAGENTLNNLKDDSDLARRIALLEDY